MSTNLLFAKLRGWKLPDIEYCRNGLVWYESEIQYLLSEIQNKNTIEQIEKTHLRSKKNILNKIHKLINTYPNCYIVNEQLLFQLKKFRKYSLDPKCKYINSHMPWSRDEVLKLRDLCKANKDAKDICQILQRSPTALYYTFYYSAFAFFRVCAPSNNDYYRKCMYRLKNEER